MEKKGDETEQRKAGSGTGPEGHRATVTEFLRQEREGMRLKQQAQQAVGGSDSDSDDELVLLGLSEMVLDMEKPSTLSGTGFVYDEIFTQHRNLWDPNYPEKPQRISQPYSRCCELGLVDRCMRVGICHSTEDQILLVHNMSMIETLQSTSSMTQEQLMELAKKYDSIYFHPFTYESSLLAVGSIVELMEKILKKQIRNGFALVRPPGHHAMEEEFCGFCFFNNVAIAAKHAVDNLGLKRVLIVDWDVHHGQATQQMFYNDPRVLYFSIHRYEYGSFWPNLRESDYDYTGDGEGKGYNINVPLNKTGMRDCDYLAILQQVLMPVAYEFDPELVFVSSGYDAAIGCREGEMLITPVAYAHFIHMLSSLAEGRMCVALEGGYCMKSLTEGIALTVRSLLGDPCPILPPMEEPCDSVTESILNVIKMLRPYWKCFQYQSTLGLEMTCPFPGVNEMPPREGIEFITTENKPKEYPLFYTYPTKVEEKYSGDRWDKAIDKLISETNLAVPPNRTCLSYDDEMRCHYNTSLYRTCLASDDEMRCHNNTSMFRHPEKPDRITRIFKKHEAFGFLERCLRVESRQADRIELEYVHSSSHVDFMMSLNDKLPVEMKELEKKYNSVYFCNESYYCASLSVGCTLNVVDNVLSGKAQNGVAIVRPPGHHAEYDRSMGFCFFNTVAIAARFAQKKYNIKRVLIVDWDIHHGNGTQHMFYEDPSVLFMSLHRYDHGCFFPSSKDGDYDMVGLKEGEGFNINIPWNEGSMGDAEYLAAFQQIIMPVAYEFAPELVLVSAGFDAALGDPLGNYDVSPVGYAHMTHMLSSLANGKVVLVLEGGYNLVSISNCMAACTSVLLGDPCPHWAYKPPKEGAVNSIQNVIGTHKKYWKSLKFAVGLPSIGSMGAEVKVISNKTDAMAVQREAVLKVGVCEVSEDAYTHINRVCEVSEDVYTHINRVCEVSEDVYTHNGLDNLRSLKSQEMCFKY
ncbi:hypothetical protein ACJMK2_016120 [Sinanodonta woodiana]|uniref:Histone deacetylase domain-containing protein n=1 Tax=Sinanodonta woodiana TaxID=1069815 RepID=A0ABD3USL8_SINWO